MHLEWVHKEVLQEALLGLVWESFSLWKACLVRERGTIIDAIFFEVSEVS